MSPTKSKSKSFDTGAAGTEPKWYQVLIQKVGPWIPLVAIIISILTFTGWFYARVIEITDRQARLEGKLELLLEDRKEILDSYKNAQSIPSSQQLGK